MGRLMAHFYDRVMKRSEETFLTEWRKGLLKDVSGRVLEVGAGTGVNLPLYPKNVERVVLSEPDPHMRARLAEKISSSGSIPAEVCDGSLESLPFPDGEFDVVICMLVLCSVPDLNRAVSEIRRVLRPAGRLVFMEHVAADDHTTTLKWQRRLEPLWKRVSGNCHFTRTTEQTLLDGGFRIETIHRDPMQSTLPLTRATIRGIAVRQSRSTPVSR
jgi:ubiquinone/menaquinone biosynthesis C-methylase UbiE